MGGVVRKLRGDRDGLPASVHLPSRIGDENSFQWAGQHAGFLGSKYDPLTLIDENWNPGTLPPTFRPSTDISPDRFSDRANLLRGIQKRGLSVVGNGPAEYATSQERAVSVLNQSSAWNAFLLDDEKPATIGRYGNHKFGRSCLVARRLVEAGVGFVTVPWTFVKSVENFDTHRNHFRLMKEFLMPAVDQAFSALIEDLAERGMLDDTLVAWTGEFGRTPKINKNAGRDHWGNVYSTVLAGGGTRGGQIYGASDRNAAEPAEDPVHVGDFVATIYHALGFDTRTVVHDLTGRPHSVVPGRPVYSLF